VLQGLNLHPSSIKINSPKSKWAKTIVFQIEKGCLCLTLSVVKVWTLRVGPLKEIW